MLNILVNTAAGIKQGSLAEMFGCGRTQITMILKHRESILTSYESNASDKRVQISKIPRTSIYATVNKHLYEWYTLACSKNIYPGGPQLIEKGLQIAAKLGITGFKGSNGWLEKWKNKYNVKQLKVIGETGDVVCETIDSWKERLPEIVHGYSKEDIWNLDETGISGWLCLIVDFQRKESNVLGKKANRE